MLNAAVIVIIILASSSGLLAIALAVAWSSFGRERHAAIWAAAYGSFAFSWGVNLIDLVSVSAPRWTALIAALLSIFSLTMIAIGFRHRAALPTRLPMFAGAAAIGLGAEIVFVFALPHSGLQKTVMLGYCTAMLAVSASALAPIAGRRIDATAKAAFWMVLLFAAYAIGLAAVAMAIPADGTGPARIVYRMMMLTGVPIGMFGVGLFAMLLLAGDLAEKLRRLATSDPLTGVLNRRGLEQIAEPLFAHCQRQRRPLAVVIADVDRFKAINDRHGHGVGDEALKRFADLARKTARKGDLFGRLGGEEFLFVLPDTDAAEGRIAMDRLRHQLVRSMAGLLPEGMTVSFGVAVLESRSETLADVMQRADQALYRSKVEGRDRVSVAETASPDQKRRYRWGLDMPRRSQA